MQAFHSIKAVIERITRQLAAARARSDFTCGECERWERCGQPPSEDCVIRAAQIARDGDRIPQHMSWWRAGLGA